MRLILIHYWYTTGPTVLIILPLLLVPCYCSSDGEVISISGTSEARPKGPSEGSTSSCMVLTAIAAAAQEGINSYSPKEGSIARAIQGINNSLFDKPYLIYDRRYMEWDITYSETLNIPDIHKIHATNIYSF